MSRYFAEVALLADGWRRDVRIEADDRGDLTAVEPDASPLGAERLAGAVVPGMPNLHAHAFQRAIAGLTERAGGGDTRSDDFWTWREAMYRSLDRLGPDELEAIAAQLYVELVRHGYTAVGEFHYVHHAADGAAYADPAELSHRMIAAARQVGIGITHLPVLYTYSDFGARAATPAQRRFVNDVDALVTIVERLGAAYGGDPQVRIGVAPHSLRAVAPEQLSAMLATLRGIDATAPIHIHVAEQLREVDACLAWSGARPVEWLLEHAPVNERWCLVHATHLERAEVERVTTSGAVVGLCPTTEANLGDGLFPLAAFAAGAGRFGIGSDSNVCVDPAEELRLLEYGQRLFHRRRVIARAAATDSAGRALYDAALQGGAQALARPIGRIAPGYRADLVALDLEHPALVGRDQDTLLDSWIFAGHGTPVREVMVGGRWVVRDGRHPAAAEILSRYREAIRVLTG